MCVINLVWSFVKDPVEESERRRNAQISRNIALKGVSGKVTHSGYQSLSCANPDHASDYTAIGEIT
jgi:predicted ATPase